MVEQVRFFCGLAIVDRFLLTNKIFLFFIYVSLAIFFLPVIIFVLGFLSTLNRLCYFPRTIHYCKKKKKKTKLKKKISLLKFRVMFSIYLYLYYILLKTKLLDIVLFYNRIFFSLIFIGMHVTCNS